jgi:hypothetical protein
MTGKREIGGSRLLLYNKKTQGKGSEKGVGDFLSVMIAIHHKSLLSLLLCV